MINRLRNSYGDDVRQIRLDLSGKSNDHKADASGLIGIMSEMARKTESAASFMLLAEGDGEVKLHEVSDDVSHIAALCLEHPGYDLMVKFRQFGVYRYGADLLAQFGVDDEVLKTSRTEARSSTLRRMPPPMD